MFDLAWYKPKNLIRLTTSKNKQDTEFKDARPVFFEELDLLGFDKFYSYPKVESPLLWAVGRNYYYKGVKIASASGGDIYTSPKLQIIHTGTIEPIDVKSLIEINREKLITLEFESKEFINSIYKEYKDTHKIGVAFSGGKDSQVILDLVLQVIPPSDFYAIFSDTEMEIPDTYKTIDDTIEMYSSIFDGFKLYKATQFKPIIENWQAFGPPSRLHRWCCTVCKSVPYLNKIINDIGKSGKNIVFEGVRREESNNRSKYSRIAEGVKHYNIINTRPILYWKDIEVYLYLFYKNIRINSAYRSGLTRVGCIVCPFASDWSEYILNKLYPDVCSKFTDIIKQNLENRGIVDTKLVKEFISKGNWKVRGGEESLEELKCGVDIVIDKEKYIFSIINPYSNIEEWIKTIPIISSIKKERTTSYQCSIEGKLRSFDIFKYENIIEITCTKIDYNDILIRFLKKISYKTAYCNNCNVCAVECPTGAIIMNKTFRIDKTKCINCQRCLNIADIGCLIAKSRMKRGDKKLMKKGKISIDKYSTFGLQENWLNNYLISPDRWSDGLGVKMITAFKNWLEDAELMENKVPTILYHSLKDKDILLIWQIIFINLSYNSEIVKWYTSLDFKEWKVKDLLDLLDSTYYHKKSSLNNPLKALIKIFDVSETLKKEKLFGRLEKKGNAFITLDRVMSDSISPEAIMYCLYKFAENNGYYDLSLNELYRDDQEHTPFKIFGINKEILKRMLTGLQDIKNGILRVEFASNLDNIYLNKDFCPLDILKIMMEVQDNVSK